VKLEYRKYYPPENLRADVEAMAREIGRPPTLQVRDIDVVDRKGGDPSEWPEDLRVREFPVAR